LARVRVVHPAIVAANGICNTLQATFLPLGTKALAAAGRAGGFLQLKP
jgi:hypothetical protein